MTEALPGDLRRLRAILDKLDVNGNAFGYNVKPSKCKLIERKSIGKRHKSIRRHNYYNGRRF